MLLFVSNVLQVGSFSCSSVSLHSALLHSRSTTSPFISPTFNTAHKRSAFNRSPHAIPGYVSLFVPVSHPRRCRASPNLQHRQPIPGHNSYTTHTAIRLTHSVPTLVFTPQLNFGMLHFSLRVAYPISKENTTGLGQRIKK